MTSPGPEQGYWVCPIHGRVDVASRFRGTYATHAGCDESLQWRARPAASSSLPPQDGERDANVNPQVAGTHAKKTGAGDVIAGERCETCAGKGTIVKDGPSEWEYDNLYPCPTCTLDRTALKGTGRKPTPVGPAPADPTDPASELPLRRDLPPCDICGSPADRLLPGHRAFCKGYTPVDPEGELARLRDELAAETYRVDLLRFALLTERALTDEMAVWLTGAVGPAPYRDNLAQGVHDASIRSLLARWRATRGEGA